MTPHVPAPRALTAAGPAPVTLSHVVIRTPRLDEVLDWYATVLGARVTYRSPMGAAITTDGEHHRIAFVAVPDGPHAAGTAPGLEHVAFKLQNLGDLLGNYLRLKDAGITPEICINHTGTISIYYRDPGGVQVELLIDAMTMDAAIEHMSSPEFEANPIGSPFDPDELARRYREGEPLASLIQPPPFDPSMFEALFAVASDAVAAVADAVEAP